MVKEDNNIKKILIAEDDYIITKLIQTIIEMLGHRVIAMVDTGEEAIKHTCELQPDAVFMDITMEYRTAGIDACKSIKKKFPEIKVFFLTAYSKDVFEEELADVQYDGYIDKMNFENTVKELLS